MQKIDFSITGSLQIGSSWDEREACAGGTLFTCDMASGFLQAASGRLKNGQKLAVEIEDSGLIEDHNSSLQWFCVRFCVRVGILCQRVYYYRLSAAAEPHYKIEGRPEEVSPAEVFDSMGLNMRALVMV